MAYKFDQPYPAYAYMSGALFLGLDERGREIGIETERHLITVAGAGGGKGAALLIPNARRWPHNLLCVDVKGENAEHSWQERRAMGQTVGAVDPFRIASVPDDLRVSINLLDGITADGFTAREDCLVIADGMVKRHDPKHAEWDDGARDIIAGLIAFVIETAPPQHRHLVTVRGLLLEPNGAPATDTEAATGLYELAGDMIECEGCGGLARAAGLTIITALSSDKGMEKDFLGGARRHTKWLDSEPIKSVLAESSFDLTSLKTGAASIYLVLPPQYIETHAAFLRLFTRAAINVMAAGGSGKGKRCLFLLDEFFTLGRIDEIAKAAGLMRSYGVHLWPFLQDLGQLYELYGVHLSSTFLGNADAQIFFHNADMPTLDYMSKFLGTIKPHEITNAAPAKTEFQEKFWSWRDEKEQRDEWARNDENAMRAHSFAMQQKGAARMAPDEIARLTGKGVADKVARSMIVFMSAGQRFNLRLRPYFLEKTRRPPLSALSNSTNGAGSMSTPFKYMTPFRWVLALFFVFGMWGSAEPSPLSDMTGIFAPLVWGVLAMFIPWIFRECWRVLRST